MAKSIIPLGDNAELIIDEPYVVNPDNRGDLIAHALVNEIPENSATLYPVSRSGSFTVELGASLYNVYYQFKVRRTLSTLEAFDQAIRHITNNPHLYDSRLAKATIERLRDLYRDELRNKR